MYYIWTEDRNEGLHFWNLVKDFLACDDLIVESKESNQGILFALTTLKPKKEDVYYIAFDRTLDNIDIFNKYIKVKALCDKFENVHLLNIQCFEMLLLKFTKLIQWTGCNRENLIITRAEILKHTKGNFLQIDDVENSIALAYFQRLKYPTSERIIKSLTREILSNDEWTLGYKNTETNKKELGRCWYFSCCVMDEKRYSRRKCCFGKNKKGYDKLKELFLDINMPEMIPEVWKNQS